MSHDLHAPWPLEFLGADEAAVRAEAARQGIAADWIDFGPVPPGGP